MSKPSSKDWKLYNNLTILDFADAKRTCRRLPKRKFGENRQAHVEEANENICSVDDAEELPIEVDTRCQKQVENKEVEPSYNDYLLDVWFLISEHILPEDVARFALICQKTRYVVSTAKFWFHLYRKYYNPKAELPTRLRPDYLIRLIGLRACVIRSLFYIYPPFVQRLRTSPDLESLLKFKCVGVWHPLRKGHWTVCFKFSRANIKPQQLKHEVPSMRDDVDDWEDIDVTEKRFSPMRNIYFNTEEGNRILLVTTDRFYPAPDFMSPNLHLSKIIQPLSQNLRTFKLELTFSEYNGKVAGTVTYDPVRQCKILRWWEPDYYLHLG